MSALPLTGIRVVDMAEGAPERCGRFLADLGAHVVRVEPPGGSPGRSAGLPFLLHNANKRGVTADLDTEAGRARLLALLSAADIWIETTAPGALATVGLAAHDVLARNPELIIVSITDFGQDGPYRDNVATSWVHTALGGLLSRSGSTGRAPLVPPCDLAVEAAALEAAWAALVGLWNRVESGTGDQIDFSVLEAAAQIVDPAMGMAGTGAVSASSNRRGRGRAYPIFRCGDGHVRVALLASRQWEAMKAWLGNPAELDDPSLETVPGRWTKADVIDRLVGMHVADRAMLDLVEEGQRRGIPIAPVLTPSQVLSTSHFAARGALGDVDLAPGVRARIPMGYVSIDGERVGFRCPAPAVGEHDGEPLPVRPRPSGEPGPVEPRRPLSGLRVLDLGVIVYGAEVGRLFADQGAEVIKIETSAYPDGGRVATGGSMTRSFVAGHRGKDGIGLNLRSPDGIELFKRMVVGSDVVLANFKPGTLESLGLGYDVLRRVNPAIVLVTSSAMGSTGPWSSWMGYGPLVRCVSGLTSLWRYPDEPDSFCDDVTTYPDHFVARVTATAALAVLIERRRTGLGAHIESAQVEAILMQLDDVLAAESREPGSAQPTMEPKAAAWPWGVYRCDGEDEWCVVTVRHDDDWRRLCLVVGDPELDDMALATTADRLRVRFMIDERLAKWTLSRSAVEVQDALQAAGVPAAAMLHDNDIPVDPHLRARGFVRAMHQPELGDIVTMGVPFRAPSMHPPSLRSAPRFGEHTREVVSRVLGLDLGETERLLAEGVLEEQTTEVLV